LKVFISATSFSNDLNTPAGEKLRAFAKEIVVNPHKRPLQGDEIIELLQDADGYIAGLDYIDAQTIERMPDSLKVISRYGVGYERVDIEAARARGIVITNTPGANTNSVADLTFALMLNAARNVCALNDRVKNGEWPRASGIEIYQKTLGIVGFGAIGRAVARRARGFDMALLAYDPYVSQKDADEYYVTMTDLKTLLVQSDVITLHMPVTEQTKNMINAQTIALMKDGVVLINTARGGLIHEGDAQSALLSGKIGALGLDAFAVEPPVGNPLLKLDNVIATPHTGAHTKEAIHNMAMMSVDNLIDVLSGKDCPYIL
jgi:D-3-phosphoglycerate dehydrogenase